jgi:ribosomal protein S18 acetylase RimI-like enzyme
VEPELRAAIETKHTPAYRAGAAAEFARLHVPPAGALLLAEETEEGPVGIGMMRILAPGVAELQRIFVAEAGRGRGHGRALTLALIEAARGAGAEIVRLDTGGPLHEAVALYRALGFREVAPYHDEYPALQPYLRFFELDLRDGAAA